MATNEFINKLKEDRRIKLERDADINAKCKTVRAFIEELDMELYAKYLVYHIVNHYTLVNDGRVELTLAHFVINKEHLKRGQIDNLDLSTYDVIFDLLDSDVIDTLDKQPRVKAVIRVSEILFLEDYLKNTLIPNLIPCLEELGLEVELVSDETSEYKDGYLRISLGV